MTLIPPADLSPRLQALWLSASEDGRVCGAIGGLQTQNPYDFSDGLLHDAWHEGWLEGVSSCTSLPHRTNKQLKTDTLDFRLWWAERHRKWKEFLNTGERK